MPTIHYEEEGELDEYIPDPTWSRPATPVSLVTSGKKRMFAIFSWLPSPNKKQKLRTVSAPERPMISGPFPLWEAPRRSSHLSSPLTSPTSPSNKSIRSVKSNASLRSVRSTASRLQGYWGRLSGKDP
ncbi:hypothetical protein PHLCEN_2v1006 [Hermanssonia centrifuga]|uniref:Uncharacterized protein n=1 Tax=Hermanssonia centrifuga TaxID=98765 RepID=A0A2R6S4F3_9APHY|nr:hypothetical protein PHLCEN_2v1006 [Hermanssonia centrifuga]